MMISPVRVIFKPSIARILVSLLKSLNSDQIKMIKLELDLCRKNLKIDLKKMSNVTKLFIRKVVILSLILQSIA